MKIQRRVQIYDEDLAQQGLKRGTTTEWIATSTGIRPFFRENLQPAAVSANDRTPWWKSKSSQTRKNHNAMQKSLRG